MSTMNVDYINPFIIAATKILKDMCSIDVKLGKPYVNSPVFLEDTLAILIGVTGAMKGQAMITFGNDVACDIASKMMMMPITEMDEISKSAIGELGNMIMGNTATIFSTKGINIDITPPTIGKGTMSFTNSYAQNISVPLLYEDFKIEINIAIRGE